MNFAFRWYGEEDLIPLEYIRHIPDTKGIVSAVYEIPVGEEWTINSIISLKNKIEAAGFKFLTVESVPVHEDIKLGKESRDIYINNFCKTLRNLAEVGVETVCYNFMPIFDWTRTNLSFVNEDGSTSLSLSKKELLAIDPLKDSLSLPGWDESYSKSELVSLFNDYKNVDSEKLWENLAYFLSKIIPVAEEVGINMAIHPDDPPYEIFGLPRIITNLEAYQRLFKIHPSKRNGVTFCSGSLGATTTNNLLQLLNYALENKRVHFVHLRNVKLHADDSFEETAHLSSYGSVDMMALMKLLFEYDYQGQIRPDHGRMIFGETGRPGYGLYDRALGISYLSGILETLKKLK